MRVRLAFVAITVAALAVVGCQPESEALPECATEYAGGPCVWHADQHGDGTGLSFTVDPAGVVTYWEPSDYRDYHKG